MADAGTALVVHPGCGSADARRRTAQAVQALAERSWRTVLVTADDALAAQARGLEAQVVLVEAAVLRRLPRTPKGLAGLPAAVQRIDAVLRASRPDVALVGTSTLPLWLLRARAARVPVVCAAHDFDADGGALAREAAALPLRLADRVLVPTDALRDLLRDAAPSLQRSTTVVVDGVAAPARVPLPRLTIDGPLRLVMTGATSSSRGGELAVAALARLVGAGVDARLELPGRTRRGDETDATGLRERARGLGLEHRVTLGGLRRSTWTSLADADVALVTERRPEAADGAAVAAVLAGRPVVVAAGGTAVDGFASALAVPPDDPAALADAVHRMLHHWSAFRRSAEALAPVAAQRFAPERFRAAIAREVALAADASAADAAAA